MSEISSDNNQPEREIDLLGLFWKVIKAIGCFFRGLGKFFIVSFVFMVRRWLPLGICLIAGGAISYLAKTMTEPSFKVDLVLKSNTVQSSDIISYINRLHTYCIENNIMALSEALSLEKAKTSEILDVNSYWIIDLGKNGVPDMVDYNNRFNVYDTLNSRMGDRLDVQVKIRAPGDLPLIRNSLLGYIDKDSLLQGKNRVRLMHNKELLTRLDYDIVQLDSLQKVKYFEETRNHAPQAGSQLVFLQEQKTQLVYPDIYDLYSRKQALESERTLYKGIVTVLNDFTITSKRTNGVIHYGIIIIPTIFLLTLLVLILSSNRSRIREIFSKY